MEKNNFAMHDAFKQLILNEYDKGTENWPGLGVDRKRIQRLVSQSVAASKDLLRHRLSTWSGNLDGALVPLGCHRGRGFLLHAKWDFERPAKPESEIVICVITGLDGDTSRLIAYRFEGPHDFDSTEGGQKHAFWHAQPTTRRIGKLSLDNTAYEPIAWMPDDTPAIPIAAGCPVSLLTAAMCSVVGASKKFRSRVKEVEKSSQYANADLVHYGVSL